MKRRAAEKQSGKSDHDCSQDGEQEAGRGGSGDVRGFGSDLGRLRSGQSEGHSDDRSEKGKQKPRSENPRLAKTDESKLDSDVSGPRHVERDGDHCEKYEAEQSGGMSVSNEETEKSRTRSSIRNSDKGKNPTSDDGVVMPRKIQKEFAVDGREDDENRDGHVDYREVGNELFRIHDSGHGQGSEHDGENEEAGDGVEILAANGEKLENGDRGKLKSERGKDDTSRPGSLNMGLRKPKRKWEHRNLGGYQDGGKDCDNPSGRLGEPNRIEESVQCGGGNSRDDEHRGEGVEAAIGAALEQQGGETGDDRKFVNDEPKGKVGGVRNEH